MKSSILTLFCGTLVTAKSWNRKISNCLKPLNPHRRLDCFCGNPAAYRKFCFGVSGAPSGGHEDFWMMKRDNTTSQVTIDQCSFCHQLHIWNRYQQTASCTDDNCNTLDKLLNTFIPKSNTTINEHNANYEECRAELRQCDVSDTRNRRSIDELKSSANSKTSFNHFTPEGSLLPVVNSSRFRKLFRKGIPYTDALRMTQAHLKREMAKRDNDPLKLCLNQQLISKCFSPTLRFRPQEWPTDADSSSWLIFNTLKFEEFFIDGDKDVEAPVVKNFPEVINRKKKKHKIPALIVPDVILDMSSKGVCPMCLDIILGYQGPIMSIRNEFYKPDEVSDETFTGLG